MSDSTEPGDRVSFSKNGRGRNASSAKATVLGGKVDMARPSAVVALVALMALSGLASIIASLLLNGHKSTLAGYLHDNNPPVTSTQAQSVSTKVGAAVTKALSGHNASSVAGNARDSAANVIGDKDVLATKSISTKDRSSQQDKARDAVTAQLKGVDGTVSAAQASDIGNGVAATVDKNLTTLHGKQLNDIDSTAGKLPRTFLIQAIVLTAALGFVAFGAYAGRYWARWAVPAVWVLSSFTGTSASFYSLINIGSGLPTGYRYGAGLSALLVIVAVVLSFVPQSRAWFAAHKPVLPDGVPVRRGLFGARVPPPTGGGLGRTRAGGARIVEPGPVAPTSASKAKLDKPARDDGAPPPKHQPAADAPASNHSKQEGAARSRPRQASKSRRTES